MLWTESEQSTLLRRLCREEEAFSWYSYDPLRLFWREAPRSSVIRGRMCISKHIDGWGSELRPAPECAKSSFCGSSLLAAKLPSTDWLSSAVVVAIIGAIAMVFVVAGVVCVSVVTLSSLPTAMDRAKTRARPACRFWILSKPFSGNVSFCRRWVYLQ